MLQQDRNVSDRHHPCPPSQHLLQTFSRASTPPKLAARPLAQHNQMYHLPARPRTATNSYTLPSNQSQSLLCSRRSCRCSPQFRKRGGACPHTLLAPCSSPLYQGLLRTAKVPEKLGKGLQLAGGLTQFMTSEQCQGRVGCDKPLGLIPPLHDGTTTTPQITPEPGVPLGRGALQWCLMKHNKSHSDFPSTPLKLKPRVLAEPEAQRCTDGKRVQKQEVVAKPAVQLF